MKHLSKKTRIEQLANDHNYNLPLSQLALRGQPRPEEAAMALATQATSQTTEQAKTSLEPASNPAQMDDCMAAMVLMFLSCRPGEQPQSGRLDEINNQIGPNSELASVKGESSLLLILCLLPFHIFVHLS